MIRTPLPRRHAPGTSGLRRIRQRALALLLAAGACLLGPGAAFAQDDVEPPGRVGRISLAEGAVSFAEAGSNAWTNAEPNRPLTRGDRLWVDRGARSEAHVGATALRMGAATHVEIMDLDDDSTQLNLTQGSLSIRIRELFQGERFEVGTPNLALALTQPGEYRIDVDAERDTTRVAVHAGAAIVYGENRETANIVAQQQMSFGGRNLQQAGPHAWLQRDAFDQWAESRDRQEEQSTSARYVSRDVIGYQQLDGYGEWRNDPALGNVWLPRVSVADWAPYRYGQWRWIAPWGWTWIDDAPWGFAPFHYGRWAQLGPRWAWVPGPRGHRAAYAPALVGFVGGNHPNAGGGANWQFQTPGGPGVAWFPLGPGDAWRPGYRGGRRYVDNVNRAIQPHRNPADAYANQRRPGAVTSIPAEEFGRGRPGRGFQRVPDADLSRARLVDAPPTPGRQRFGGGERPPPPRALPPAAVLNQPAPPAGNVAPTRRFGVSGAPPAGDPRGNEFQQRRQEQMQREQVQREQAQRDQAQREQFQREQAQRQQELGQRQAREQQERAQRQQQEMNQRQAQEQEFRARRQADEPQRGPRPPWDQRDRQERMQRQPQQGQPLRGATPPQAPPSPQVNAAPAQAQPAQIGAPPRGPAERPSRAQGLGGGGPPGEGRPGQGPRGPHRDGD